MFEQELYNEPATVPSHEGDLFHNYEVKNWDLGPRIYKILAFSAIFNIAALAFVAQSDLLTRKGCDSPWAERVCQVLDMAYVGTMIFGTEREFIDKEYEKIDLGDAEITFIDASNISPPLDYPEGYFQIANPVQFEMLKQQQANGEFTSTYNPITTAPSLGNDLISKVPELPKPNNDSVVGQIPDSPFSTDDSASTPVIKRGKNGKPISNRPITNSNSDQVVAQNDANTNANTSSNTSTQITSDPIAGVEINKRPLVDLANSINALKEKGPLNLESEFTITGKGRIDQTGRLDKKTFLYGPTTGTDQAAVDVVKESIEAVNEAGYFAYIKDAIDKNVKFVDLNFVLTQNAENVEATIETPLANESLAKSRKSSFDFFLGMVKSRKQGENASQNDKDDLSLLEGIQTEVAGKVLRIKFVIPKGMVHPMIQRKLQDQAAELKKPNGILNSTNRSNSAAK